MAPKNQQQQNTVPTATQSTVAQPTASVSSNTRQELATKQTIASQSDRQEPAPLDTERQQLVDKVRNSFGARVYQELARYQPGRDTQWLAERVVDQAEVNAKNAFKHLSEVTDRELVRASRITLSQLDNKVITPREGPKANNRGLISNSADHIADAILQSVTHYGAHQTLQNYRNNVGDQKFVEVVKPALMRGELLAWSNTEFKHHGEELQHELVHRLLMDGKIPQEHRYTSHDPKDLYAIGIEYQQQQDARSRRYAERKEADARQKEAKQQEILDGYLTGATNERERAHIMRNWKRVAENPSTDDAHAQRLLKALDRARANEPKPEPVSQYIDSTHRRYSAADIKVAEQFAPHVAAAMKAKSPNAYEQSRPATQEEIVQLRQKLQETHASIERGLERSRELSKKISAIGPTEPTAGLAQLVAEDRQKLENYQKTSKDLQGTLQKISALCNSMEKADVSSPNYQRLLSEFKTAQRELLQSDGMNAHRATLGRELVAVETRYRLGNEYARNLSALDRLSPEDKRKTLLTLEGTLSAQLSKGVSIAHTMEAIQHLDNDPKRIASYLYRLERSNEHELVEKFVRSLDQNVALKNRLYNMFSLHVSANDSPQKERIKNILGAFSVPEATAA